MITAYLQTLADNVSFKASANKTQVATGERFQITFTLNTSGTGFTPPDLNEFRILSGPNQSTSMEWINGSMSSSISFSYILMAIQEGEFTIGPAKIKTDNGILSSNMITIKVIKGANFQRQQSQNQTQQNIQPSSSNDGKFGNDVFIRLITDKSEVFQGEQLIATYKLFYRINIVDYNVNRLPAPKGFWAEDIKLPENIRPNSENVNGKVYNTAVFKKVILYPQETGKLKLDPMDIELVLRLRDRGRPHSIFDQFFGTYKDVKYIAKSNSKTITVIPLPTTKKPVNFNGAVGKFNIKAIPNKYDINTNEAINYKITISGHGNLKLLQDPQINFPPDFEVYDPKIKDNFTISTNGVNGSRTYEYLIIPRVAGSYTLEPIDFSYFNPETESYNRIQTEKYEIHVGKGDGNEVSSFHSVSKEDLQVLGKDIRYIKTGKTKFKKIGESFYKSNRFYAAIISPFIFLLIFLFVRNKYLSYTNDTKRVKRQMATRWAKRRLSKAAVCLKKNDKKQFFIEISLALYGYLGDKLGIDSAEMDRNNINEKLLERNISKECISKLMETLDLCEMARFAPIEHNSDKKVYENTLNILSLLEKEIK